MVTELHWDMVVGLPLNAELFCGAGVNFGLCPAVEQQITSEIKVEQLKTQYYIVLVCLY